VTPFARIRSILAAVCGIEDASTITPLTTLDEDLGFDALDFGETASRIEEEFGIEIPLGEEMAWTNLASILADVEAKLRETP